MDVLKYFKKQILPPTLRPLQLVAKQSGASILVIGDKDSEKVKTFQSEITTPFGSVAPLFVITAQPELWVNRPQTMVIGVSPRTVTPQHYLAMVNRVAEAVKSHAQTPHVIVALDNSEYLGKHLKEAFNTLKKDNVELVVFREQLAKTMSDQSNVRMFERVALFKSNAEALTFLRKHKSVQNTLIWFNAKDAKPGKYWIV